MTTPDARAGTPQAAPAPSHVVCPVCLARLAWSELPLYRWDAVSGEYVTLKVPSAAGPEQRAHAERGAMIRCPDPIRTMSEHYLPADYGRYGRPVVLGIIGATGSGKTHLLSAMVGAVERGDLAACGATSRPIHQGLHSTFLSEKVLPLLDQGKVLEATKERVVSFADAWLIGPAGGPERPVALFDVAGGELGREQVSAHGAKNFLEVVDGLIFVIDPAALAPDRMGEDTFNTVLDLLHASGRRDQVSAAVVLNKADLLRFEDPVTRWLRAGPGVISADAALSESADIFAYLDSRGAQAWTRPYRECARGTLHVVSATGGPSLDTDGGAIYPRGVRPRRVLAPLVALLAMVGVFPGEQAQRIGN